MPVKVGPYVLPDDAEAIRRSQKAAGLPFHMDTLRGDGCHNCGGAAFLVVRAPHEQGRKHLSGKEFEYSADGLWWNAKAQTYPCPVCNADNRDRFEILYRLSGLGVEEREWRIDFVSRMEGKQDAFKAAIDLLARAPRPCGMVALFGSYGVGKSGIMKALVAQFILAGVSARYVLAEDILGEIRSTYRDGSPQSEGEVIDQYRRYSFLAVDEIDRTGDTAHARAKLFSVLNARYDDRHLRATVFATNQDIRQMPDDWKYLESRLKDARRVLMGGDDLRGNRK